MSKTIIEKNMKKILSVTIWDYTNFGNRLQAYALNSLLQKDMGCEVYNLVYGFYEPADRKIKSIVKNIMGCLGVSRFRHLRTERIRYKSNLTWSQEHFTRQIPIGNRYERLQKQDFSKYDFVITGSDQVWHNWDRQDRELDYYYLQFIPENKRLCFSPSFGFETVPDADRESHRKGLQGMPILSCREQAGCEIIRELTGRTASLIPDPTLCLDRRDWEQLSEPPAEPLPENYILLFFLGGINNETKKSINDAALQMDLRIVDVGRFTTNKYFSLNAGNFLWMIQHASFICTDSFHATVFSIIFQRDFYAFRRNSMSLMFDRIETLLERFDMKDRIIREHAFFSSQIEKDRFLKAEQVLRESRRQALNYLANDCGLMQG